MDHKTTLVEPSAWGDYSLYCLENSNGVRVEISDLGASIVSFKLKDRYHRERNIVLGYNRPEHYLAGQAYVGGVVGPWGNRIENGRYDHAGNTIQLCQNEESNHLHGGDCELHKRRWDVTILAAQGVTLETQVNKGEGGYPANLRICVTYRLSDANELTVHYWVESDDDCPVNLTHHAYFNLSGGKHDVQGHIVAIDADEYWDTNAEQIPTQSRSVMGTAMDFLQPKRIALGFATEEAALVSAGGYDHCFILNGEGLRPVGWAFEQSGGIVLEVMSDRPAMQFYTGNHLGDHKNSFGKPFGTHMGFCFETQSYPNQVNMPDIADQVLVTPNRPFNSTTVFKASVEGHA
ncbi:aldose epimerase family protein [Vibrio parahaemolyticus]|uniref:aldose epimerase family protein n=1 Tax=Vibrio sp. EA2 TaxID=3079860 RepID=UPI00294A02A9|nr:aldose epimerase family protein [Vibrio sp. EA2]MDV6253813.1 aldose epimerase family protein [Vibrio sp. EA2]